MPLSNTINTPTIFTIKGVNSLVMTAKGAMKKQEMFLKYGK
jgi:hypothetical protein